MLIIPAIDIKDGCVVRFVQGRLDKKIYSRDPLKTAKHWVKQGAELIHIVDLDGAISGTPKNLDIVKGIARNIDAPVQFGGGIRTIEMIRKLLDGGIWRVILGTQAIENKNFLKKAFDKFKERVIVSLDAKNNTLLIKGWHKISSNYIDVLTFAQNLRDIGFKQLIYTDVSKDGTLKGPNIRAIKKILNEVKIDIIASGGVSSLDDLRRLKVLEKKGIVGVIIGKALYEARFTLSEALKLK